jgi:hypothetical protein
MPSCSKSTLTSEEYKQMDELAGDEEFMDRHNSLTVVLVQRSSVYSSISNQMSDIKNIHYIAR